MKRRRRRPRLGGPGGVEGEDWVRPPGGLPGGIKAELMMGQVFRSGCRGQDWGNGRIVALDMPGLK